MRVYAYPSSPKAVHDTIPGLEGTTPFSGFGFSSVADGCDLFWMGQYSDRDLIPAPSLPGRHVIELEGDWRSRSFPGHLRDVIIITANPQPGFGCFVRPVMSPLLVRLVRSPPEYEIPRNRRAWFRGQRDPYGVRERLGKALKSSGIPHEFSLNGSWKVYSPDVGYVHSMIENSVSLCPRGYGRATCRFYESCAFGRSIIVISDTEVLGNIRWPCSVPEDAVDRISDVWEPDHSRYTRAYFDEVVLPYFRDPTQAFLRWFEGCS